MQMLIQIQIQICQLCNQLCKSVIFKVNHLWKLYNDYINIYISIYLYIYISINVYVYVYEYHKYYIICFYYY